MSTPIIYPPSVNGLQKTLDASLLAGVTASATLNNVTDIQNLKGLMVIDRVDGNNNLTPNKREYISFAGVSGSTVITLVRGLAGSTDQDHAVGAIVEFVSDVLQQQAIIDGLLKVVDTNGDLLKATGATINTGLKDDEIVTPKAIADSKIFTPTNLAYFNAPQGFLINGKIVPSVGSNNLTVAIKGLDGNDPSATNPVYCRIGDTIRSITAALSVTKNAGTNWCNAGSAELATKEIDYFVYLGYNATDGVVIGFSRIPYATLYSDFSATATDEKYCGISTITTAAAGDAYENIGRFAATLSAGAGYTWTVPTFTTANLIQRPIYETRRLSWLPTYGGTGSMTFAVTTTTQLDYQILNRRCICRASVIGTTGGVANSGITFSLPISRILTIGYELLGAGRVYDAAWDAGIPASNDTSQSVITVGKSDNSNWGLAAGKYVYFDISYST